MAYIPGEKQLKFLSWEVGMFFHFGIRSFYPGHRDWDGVEMGPDKFNPTELNVRNWLKAAKLIGAKYAILTAKHHDGFALWPTKFSPYGVAASPWKDGKGDVVKEFVSACREEGIAVGLYYSPAQWGKSAVSFSNEKEYDDYFIGQIGELLTNYGKIDYLWFDGCGSDGHKYDQERIIGAIRQMQPGIIIFDMWDGDTRWVGNEDGYAPYPNPYVVKHKILGEEKTVFIPAECDCKLRETWFYDHNEETIKSVEELAGMYELSVGRGCNLLLNVGPDDRGLINESDMKRLYELSNELNRRFGMPLPFGDIVKPKDNAFGISLIPEVQSRIKDNAGIPAVRYVILRENISMGQRVKRFKLYARIPSINPVSDRRVCVFSGETIGNKAIIPLTAMRTATLELEIIESDGEASISEFKAY